MPESRDNAKSKIHDPSLTLVCRISRWAAASHGPCRTDNHPLRDSEGLFSTALAALLDLENEFFSTGA